MTAQPETRFADGPDGQVAYQVWGRGEVDLLLVLPWLWTVEVMWEQPRIERYLRRLGTFCRVIAFDKRGTGVSDPVPLGALPTLEQWTDDITVVMHAAGCEQAAVLGVMEGAQMAMLFAGLHPERTRALVVIDGAACYLRRDDYPIGIPQRLVETAAWVMYGQRSRLQLSGPSFATDAAFATWWAHFERLSIPPTVLGHMFRHGMQWDVRSALPAISAPTLVMHHAGNRYIRPSSGRYVADHVDLARYRELSGADTFFFSGDQDESLGEIEALLTGARSAPEHDRVLATVLFTDLVSSTRRATEVGDARWHDLLDLHDRTAAEHVARYRGRLVKSTGDGVLATFDGPARAIRCAADLGDALRTFGLEVRAGLHAGEVELRGDDIGGIAVHAAARVMAEAGRGEILVSHTVKDLVLGSGIDFEDRGEHQLRDVDGRWRLFAYRH